MHKPASHDLGTRRTGEIILEVFTEPVALPEGERAHVRRALGEFGDDRVMDVNGLSQMAHQGLKELLSRTARGPLDQRVKGTEILPRRALCPTPPGTGPRRTRLPGYRLSGIRFIAHRA